MVLRGKDVIEVTRKMMGYTAGHEAIPGTIRGDLAISERFNLIHGSDSAESAEKEIRLFFGKKDLIENRQSDLKWIYDMSGEDII
jgi:nucleoside-diphosphate kinase